MDGGAVISCTRVFLQLRQCPQTQYLFSIDRIGIAHPDLNPGNGKLGRAGRNRRTRCRCTDRCDRKRAIQYPQPGQIGRGLPPDGKPHRTVAVVKTLQQIGQPVDPARCHSRRAVPSVGTGHDDIGLAGQLGKIMRGKTNPPVRRRQTEFATHRAAHPRVGAVCRWPDLFVEAPQNDLIKLLQAGFHRAQNR